MRKIPDAPPAARKRRVPCFLKGASMDEKQANKRQRETSKSKLPQPSGRGCGSQKESLKKSSALYVLLLIVWTLLTGSIVYCYAAAFSSGSFLGNEMPARGVRTAAIVLLIFNAIFIAYFWLNGAKDFLYVIWYYTHKKKLEAAARAVTEEDVRYIEDKVVMLYCTCNDFDGDSLCKSLRQTYRHVDCVILDDSSDPAYRDAVDRFAAAHGIKVVRRADRSGFKAGNINHYLQSDEAEKEGYSYAVILDSDEIIPADFTVKCLRYFYHYSDVGIVQASHVATRNRNFFMKLFHIGVDSHWNTYQGVKHLYGFSSMLGHGAMISLDCYRAAGGFPPLVAEDLCLSIEMRERGFKVAYAPDIICEEEYPVDYEAFKKRHSKWTQGNMEFIRKYTGRIARSKMRWFEKLDIVLFTYNLPLTAVFAFYILLNIVVLPLLGVNVGAIYSPWMLVPTVIFFISPMLNDVVCWFGRLNFFRFCLYMFCVIVLYGSMFYVTLSASFLGLFGRKAKFIVTPKRSDRVTLRHALRAQYKEILFSTVLIAVSVFCAGGVLPVLLISGTGYCSLFLLFFSNRRYEKNAVCLVDEQTVRLTLRRNGLISPSEADCFCAGHITAEDCGEQKHGEDVA